MRPSSRSFAGMVDLVCRTHSSRLSQTCTPMRPPSSRHASLNNENFQFPYLPRHDVQTLRQVRRLCDVIDEAVRLRQRESLSLDVAILEGAEADPARHDRSGPLYPINTLRNLALLQARK